MLWTIRGKKVFHRNLLWDKILHCCANFGRQFHVVVIRTNDVFICGKNSGNMRQPWIHMISTEDALILDGRGVQGYLWLLMPSETQLVTVHEAFGLKVGFYGKCFSLELSKASWKYTILIFYKYWIFTSQKYQGDSKIIKVLFMSIWVAFFGSPSTIHFLTW